MKNADYIKNNPNFEVCVHKVFCDETSKELGWNAYIANLKTGDIENYVSEGAIDFFKRKSDLFKELEDRLGKLKSGKAVFFK